MYISYILFFKNYLDTTLIDAPDGTDIKVTVFVTGGVIGGVTGGVTSSSNVALTNLVAPSETITFGIILSLYPVSLNITSYPAYGSTSIFAGVTLPVSINPDGVAGGVGPRSPSGRGAYSRFDAILIIIN